MKKFDLKSIYTLIFAVLLFAVLLFVEISGKTKKHSTLSTAMGTYMGITIYGGDEADTGKLLNVTDECESRISYRLDNSEIALLNQNNYSQSLSQKTLDLINLSLDVSRLSNGAFDISLQKLTGLWNIDELSFKQQNGEEVRRIPSSDEIADALKQCGYENIEIDKESVSLHNGVQIDLGGVGKGAALDECREYLKEHKDIMGACITLGGSVLLYGEKPVDDGFNVALVNPFSPEESMGYLQTLKDCFVSTSGSYERYIEFDGKRYHHIFDAESGYPAFSDIASATVISDNGALSDALSTACFVLGRDKAEALLKEYDAQAVFVMNDGEVIIYGDNLNFFTQSE